VKNGLYQIKVVGERIFAINPNNGMSKTAAVFLHDKVAVRHDLAVHCLEALHDEMKLRGATYQVHLHGGIENLSQDNYPEYVARSVNWNQLNESLGAIRKELDALKILTH
jgi:hypothetical protein